MTLDEQLDVRLFFSVPSLHADSVLLVLIVCHHLDKIVAEDLSFVEPCTAYTDVSSLMLHADLYGESEEK